MWDSGVYPILFMLPAIFPPPLLIIWLLLLKVEWVGKLVEIDELGPPPIDEWILFSLYRGDFIWRAAKF
jgi:hypothetical protein